MGEFTLQQSLPLQLSRILVYTEVLLEVVGAEFVAQEGGELLILFDERVFEMSAENMVAVIDAVENGVKLAAHSFGDAHAEDFRNLAAGHAPQSDIAGPFEDLPDWEVAPENEIPAILDLSEEKIPPQVHGLALATGEFGPKHQGPVLEAIADDVGTEAIGSGLQRFGIVIDQQYFFFHS